MNRDELDLLAARLAPMIIMRMVPHYPKWMSLNEACAYAAGMSRETMSKLIDEGHIYAKKTNDGKGKIIVDRETIDKYLNSGRLN